VAEWAYKALSGDILSRANLESIKEDIEKAIHIPPLLETEAGRRAGPKSVKRT
jgi:hypothetical protein